MIRREDRGMSSLRRVASAGGVSRLRPAGAELVHPETHRAGGRAGREQELLRHREEDELAQGAGKVREEPLAQTVARRKLRAAREQDEPSHRVRLPGRELDGDGAAQRVPRGDDRAGAERVEQPRGHLAVGRDARVRRRLGPAVSGQVEGHDPQRALQAPELVDPVARADPRAVKQEDRRRGRRVAGRQVGHAASLDLHEPPRDRRVVEHRQAWPVSPLHFLHSHLEGRIFRLDSSAVFCGSDRRVAHCFSRRLA